MKKQVISNISLMVFILAISLSVKVFAQDEKQVVPQDSTKSKKEKKYFELSLGHSLLFISDTRLEEIKTKESVIVPTSAILFFAELRPVKKIKVPIFINLPTENKQFLVDGQLYSEKTSPTFGTGVQFRVFKLPLGEKSAIEMEAGPLASFLLNKGGVIRFAPVVAGRLRFIKNNDFVIYVGSSYSIGLDAFGVLFGTGYIF